jgi:hypothetical protein
MKTGLFLSVFAGTVLIGCSPVQVRKAAKHVKVSKASTVQSLQHCQYIGAIQGQSADFKMRRAMRGAKNDLRNRAIKQGGNLVTWNTRTVIPLQVAIPLVPSSKNPYLLTHSVVYGHHIRLKGKVYFCRDAPGCSTL